MVQNYSLLKVQDSHGINIIIHLNVYPHLIPPCSIVQVTSSIKGGVNYGCHRLLGFFCRF